MTATTPREPFSAVSRATSGAPRFALDTESSTLPAVVRCGALKGAAHAFSTRRGAQGAALDFRSDGGALPYEEAVAQLAATIGVARHRVYRVQQVHGARVVVVDTQPTAVVGSIEADALITNVAGTAVAVATADCLPVLISDPEQRVVAAAHGGWRGLRAGVLACTVARMVQHYGCVPQRLVAAVGPAIGPEAYEVGTEVADAFSAVSGALRKLPRDGGWRWHLDLGGVAAQQLREAGVERTYLSGWCTYSHAELFHSYRRDGAAAGRQLSVIGLSSDDRGVADADRGGA